jgi:SagB-type dehydrogenase family enzyme
MSRKMNRREFLMASAATGTYWMGANLLDSPRSVAFAQDLKPIQLPRPRMDAGKPLMQVIRERKSLRDISAEKLPPQVMSDMLWAAFGINRPDSGKRTAPSANNRQEIDIYVATGDGLYLYDPKPHDLKPVLAEDIRPLAGRQAFVKEAPVNLIYVADFSRTGTWGEQEKQFYTAADTGFIAQNVYLYCASEGLATVVRGGIDRSVLAKAMRLRPDQKVTLAQTVGYPKK